MEDVIFFRQKIEPALLPKTITAKWPGDVLDEGFVPFPKRLLRSMSRIFTDKNAVEKLAVVLAVVDFQREKLIRDPSVEFLAFIAGMPKDNFFKVLTALEKEKLLSVVQTETGLRIRLDGLLKKVEEITED